MSKARLRIHDLSRNNHQETIETLQEAISLGRTHDTDGAIIILTDRRGRQPTILRAGKMTQDERALLQLARLKLHLVVDSDE